MYETQLYQDQLISKPLNDMLEKITSKQIYTFNYINC